MNRRFIIKLLSGLINSTNPVYEIASPLYRRVTIDLGGRFGRGKTFTMIANHASRKNMYIQSANLNGRELNSFSFPAKELLQGGKLILEMGPKPNKNWGVQSSGDKTMLR